MQVPGFGIWNRMKNAFQFQHFIHGNIVQVNLSCMNWTLRPYPVSGYDSRIRVIFAKILIWYRQLPDVSSHCSQDVKRSAPVITAFSGSMDRYVILCFSVPRCADLHSPDKFREKQPLHLLRSCPGGLADCTEGGLQRAVAAAVRSGRNIIFHNSTPFMPGLLSGKLSLYP